MRGYFKPDTRHNESWMVQAYTLATDALDTIIDLYEYQLDGEVRDHFILAGALQARGEILNLYRQHEQEQNLSLEEAI